MSQPVNEPQPQGPTPEQQPCCTGGGEIEIRVAGHLDSSWSRWLGDLEVRPTDGGETLLIGPVADQAALIGILEKLYRANIRLVSFHPASRSASGNLDRGTGAEPGE